VKKLTLFVTDKTARHIKQLAERGAIYDGSREAWKAYELITEHAKWSAISLDGRVYNLPKRMSYRG